jgi:uncharacterized protein YhfF
VTDDRAGLPKAEFAFPGPLRDKLTAAVLAGDKTAGTCLLIEHHIDGTDPFDQIGRRSVMIDSQARPLALLVCTGVEVRRLAEVDLQHALDEGEGFETVAQWREAHERFWSSAEYRAYVGDEAAAVTDDTMVVLDRFEVVERL